MHDALVTEMMISYIRLHPLVNAASLLEKMAFEILKSQTIAKQEKSILFCGVQHSVILADFIMPETQQHIIVIILMSTLLTFKGFCRTLGIYFR